MDSWLSYCFFILHSTIRLSTIRPLDIHSSDIGSRVHHCYCLLLLSLFEFVNSSSSRIIIRTGGGGLYIMEWGMPCLNSFVCSWHWSWLLFHVLRTMRWTDDANERWWMMRQRPSHDGVKPTPAESVGLIVVCYMSLKEKEEGRISIIYWTVQTNVIDEIDGTFCEFECELAHVARMWERGCNSDSSSEMKLTPCSPQLSLLDLQRRAWKEGAGGEHSLSD